MFYFRGLDVRHFKPAVYHEEGVSYPETPPAGRTGRDGHVLAVDRHGLRRRLTHRTPGDKHL